MTAEITELSSASSIRQRLLTDELISVINKHNGGLTGSDVIGVLETIKLSFYGQHFGELDY